jgi:hypothetical protein
MRAFLALLFVCLCGAAQAAPWHIVKDHWDAADEAGFGRFVTALGDSGCNSSQSCLRDPANPWRGSDGRFLDVDVDCAKLPYLLRAYYAWKNGLPFSYVDGVAGSRFGHTANRIVSRAGMIDHGDGIDAPAAIRAMIDNVYSGTFRTDAAQDGAIPADFYSPALQPGSIRPGTVIYDTNAHVGIVYRVGTSAPSTYVVQGRSRHTYTTGAAPTTGTWALGDVCDNDGPVVGSPKGWLCTVAGTPGTWVSTGNL